MSKAERGKSFLIWGTVLLLVLSLPAAFLCGAKVSKNGDESVETRRISALLKTLPLLDTEIEYYKDGVVSVSAKCARRSLLAFLEERKIKNPIPPAFFPKEMSVSARARVKFSEDGESASFTLLEIRVNGKEVPRKLFENVAELKLDFESPLVYN